MDPQLVSLMTVLHESPRPVKLQLLEESEAYRSIMDEYEVYTEQTLNRKYGKTAKL